MIDRTYLSTPMFTLISRLISRWTFILIPLYFGCDDTTSGSGFERGDAQEFAGEEALDMSDVGGESLLDLGVRDDAGDQAGDDASMMMAGVQMTPSLECESAEIGAPTLRRLTRLEFERNARDALHLPLSWIRSTLPPDPVSTHGLNNHAERQVTQRFAQELLASAEVIARLARDEPILSIISPCHSEADEACAQTFLETTGQRLYQRPLTELEVSNYLGLFTYTHDSSLPFGDFIEWSIVAMLMSPYSIFRSEIGVQMTSENRRMLNDFEVATALSYLVTGRGAHHALITQAAQGDLSDPNQLMMIAQRMAFIEETRQPTPEFREVLIEFMWQWLDFGGFEVMIKDHPAFEAMREPMRDELERYLNDVLFDQGGGIEQLLISDALFSSEELLDFYGLPAGVEHRPHNTGAGLLSLGYVMAMTSPPQVTHPTKRGAYVREKILCHAIPAPPPDIPELPEPEPSQTTRQRYEIHVESPACQGCHLYLDGIGFGFEGFDELGRPRTHENGVPIDDSWLGVGTAEGIGATDLVHALASQPNTYDCATKMTQRFAFGVDDTRCFLPEAEDLFRRDQIGFVDLYLSLTQADHFRYRQCVGDECEETSCQLTCQARGASCDNQVAVSDTGDGVVTSECSCDYSEVEERTTCSGDTICRFGSCVEVDACDLDCQPRGGVCDGLDLITDTDEGIVTSECTCDYSAVERRELCADGLICRAGECALPRQEETFVLIPAGTFNMGSLDDELGRMLDETSHEVTLTRDFYLQSTEVTQGQWEEIMGDNPSIFSACGERCPVERVTWFAAITYANARSELEGLDPCYDDLGVVIGSVDGNPYECEGYRLPTEAEWEYAARAGTDTATFNGDLMSIGCERDPTLSSIGWYCGNAEGQTHQVALKEPNSFGLYDTQGNVKEWIFDTYRGDYQSLPNLDPFNIVVSHRVIRGGSWGTGGASTCRSANRQFADARYIDNGLGLRLARTSSIP